jgi:D-amino peptidase
MCNETMKVLLWSDMEGPSGIDDHEMFADAARYKTARSYATQDVNAAVRGVRRAEARAEIDVFDGHGMGDNLLEEELESGCNLLGGGWMTRFHEMVKSREVAKYDAVLLLGQHAAEGTVDGFMSHTNTGDTALRVNGKDAGEAPQLAWLFGHFNVPVVLVVGDDAVVREAKALLPGIATVAESNCSRQSTKHSNRDSPRAYLRSFTQGNKQPGGLQASQSSPAGENKHCVF